MMLLITLAAAILSVAFAICAAIEIQHDRRMARLKSRVAEAAEEAARQARVRALVARATAAAIAAHAPRAPARDARGRFVKLAA